MMACAGMTAAIAARRMTDCRNRMGSARMRQLRVVVLAAFALGFAAPAFAQSWPSKPIKIIVPFPPGNTTDIMARLIGPKITERLGQPVLVENRPGASGMLGLDFVAKAAPDGYTIAAGQGGNLVVLPHTSKNIPYDALKDFAPIAVSTTNYLGIVAYPGTPFKTVGEMVAWAKANPGKLTVATNGEGGFPHLVRAIAGDGGLHVHARSLQGLGADRHRRDRRPGAGGDRRHHGARSSRALGPGAAARDHEQDARAAVARRSRGGGGRSRLRIRRLVRLRRPGRDAARDRAQAQRRDQSRDQVARGERQARDRRADRRRRIARIFQRAHPQRPCQVRQADARHRLSAAVTGAAISC